MHRRPSLKIGPGRVLTLTEDRVLALAVSGTGSRSFMWAELHSGEPGRSVCVPVIIMTKRMRARN